MSELNVGDIVKYTPPGVPPEEVFLTYGFVKPTGAISYWGGVQEPQSVVGQDHYWTAQKPIKKWRLYPNMSCAAWLVELENGDCVVLNTDQTDFDWEDEADQEASEAHGFYGFYPGGVSCPLSVAKDTFYCDWDKPDWEAPESFETPRSPVDIAKEVIDAELRGLYKEIVWLEQATDPDPESTPTCKYATPQPIGDPEELRYGVYDAPVCEQLAVEEGRLIKQVLRRLPSMPVCNVHGEPVSVEVEKRHIGGYTTAERLEEEVKSFRAHYHHRNQLPNLTLQPQLVCKKCQGGE